jgi:CheY-like chemotaxis protein
MPVLDGIEAAKQIQQQLKGKIPHILMVSAYDKDEAKQLAFNAGIDKFIEKPVNQSILVDAIADLLSREVQHLEVSEDNEIQIPDLSSFKVLLVEDNLINQQVAQEFLNDTRISVECAENGVVALEKLASQAFDIVLMDIQMPVMDGEQALNFIQATGCSAPILALTANTMQHEIDRYIKLGFTDHLAKPIDRDEFNKKVSHYLNISLQEDIDIPNEEFELLKQKYLSGLYEQKVQLQNQLKYHDIEGLGRSVHAIKGTAGMFGCTDIQKWASELDDRIKSKCDESDIVHLVNGLILALEEAIKQAECDKAAG